MKFKSEIIGWFVTGLYLVAIAALACWKRDTWSGLTLNEIGDFLAGAFGPIAFLWLVLGYIQQGRELKVSSDALVQQVEELRKSGEQYAHLVEVGREQNAAQITANNYERMRYERSMNAHILFYPGACVASGDLFIHTFEIHNAGAEAIDVEFLCKIPGHNFYGTYAFLKRDERVRMPITFKMVEEDYSSIFNCFYSTLDGRKICFQKNLTISAASQRIAITSLIKIEDL